MPENDMFSLDGLVGVVIGGGGVLAGEMATGDWRKPARTSPLWMSASRAPKPGRAEIRALGRRAIGVRADATKKADLQSALDTVLSQLGRVDILLNAAGVNSGTPFFEITEEEWHRILDIDLKSVFLACQVFGKAMVDAGRGGSVINISSACSSPPLSKVFTYSVAKGGVNQITQFLAREWAPYNVRVNAILPGFFPAEQNRKLLTEERTNSIMTHTPMGRFGESSRVSGRRSLSGFSAGRVLRNRVDFARRWRVSGHDDLIRVSQKHTRVRFNIAAGYVPGLRIQVPWKTKKQSRKTILVVDDEPEVRKLVSAMVTANGYNVLTADTGDHAFTLFKNQKTPIDLLLTDVVAPGMSGPMLADKLPEQQPGSARTIHVGLRQYASGADVRRRKGTRIAPQTFHGRGTGTKSGGDAQPANSGHRIASSQKVGPAPP